MARAGNPNQYLKKLGQTWYVSVRVPRTLEKLVGNTHIRRSLKTRDLDEANIKKHALVAEVKAELASLQKAGQQPGLGYTYAEAREWREEFRKVEAAGQTEQAAEMSTVLTEQAEAMEKLYGTERAKKWFRTAISTGNTLKELQDSWLKVSDYKESTNLGHKKALAEVLDYLKDEDARPEDVTRAVAVKFIEGELTQRGLAYNTIRDRLASLSAFWGWIDTRGLGSASGNPWSGHKVSKKANRGSTPPKRAYTNEELIALLKGNDTVKKWPTYSYLPDLLVLGMYTGCRAEELCGAKAAQFEKLKGGYVINVKDAKTKAGNRPVGVTYPAAMKVLERRLKGASADTQLFTELSPGGPDKKFSFAAVKAFGRYRRACGVPDGTDLHSLRRCAVTQLERAGVGEREIARFVGHKIGTMAGDVYSEGAGKHQALSTSLRLRYAAPVERAVFDA